MIDSDGSYTLATQVADDSGVANADDKMTLEEGEANCSWLSYGGVEWRLSTIKELLSIVD